MTFFCGFKIFSEGGSCLEANRDECDPPLHEGKPQHHLYGVISISMIFYLNMSLYLHLKFDKLIWLIASCFMMLDMVALAFG